MKRKYRLFWLLTVLFAVSLTVLLNWQKREIVSLRGQIERTESSVIAPERQQSQEAILADASHVYCICSSRSRRVLPSPESKKERTITPLGSFVLRQHIVKHIYTYYDSRCRKETAPFCMSASRDYYVIALRRIIR